MKFLVTCSLLGLLAMMSLAKADAPDMAAIKQACLKETNAPAADVQKLFASGMADATEPVKCFLKCVMEKLGDIKNGAFDADAFVKNMQNMPNMSGRQAEIAKVAAICKGEKGANPCDTAYKLVTCFKKNKLEPSLAKP